MSLLHPYAVEVYMARDGSDVCLSLTSSKAYCAQDGAVREVKLELEFKRYEVVEHNKKQSPCNHYTGSHTGLRPWALRPG